MSSFPFAGPLRVASLTTLPSRFPYLDDTLKSLVEQSVPFDDIVLALPPVSTRENTTYDIRVVQHLLSKYGVQILESEHDWGPATKFIPIIKRELAAARMNTLVFVVDDDQM